MYRGVEVAEVVLSDFVDQDVTCAAFDRDCVGRCDADRRFVTVGGVTGGVGVVVVNDAACRAWGAYRCIGRVADR